MNFEYRPELLIRRAQVMDILTAAGFRWLWDFRNIDLDHENMLIEVDGIRDGSLALDMSQELSKRLRWRLLVCRRDYDDQDWMIKIHADVNPATPVAEPRHVTEQHSTHKDGSGKPETGNASASVPMASIGGNMNKALRPGQMLGRFGKMLQNFSREDYSPAIALVANDGADDWDGMVLVVVRLEDVRMTVGQLRQLLPLLRVRSDLVNLAVATILLTCRDCLGKFIADLPASTSIKYEALALGHQVDRHGMKLLPPSPDALCWRIVFCVHCSAISQVLDQQLQELAAEGKDVGEIPKTEDNIRNPKK